jgi:hypothetical protein
MKSAGTEDTLEIPLDSFNRLYLHSHIVYSLIQDSLNKVVITGGSNLLPHIRSTVTDGQLEISNENKCNFLRSYKKKVTVEIHFSSLINIHFEGSEPMTNRGTLKFDWLTFLIRDGAGPVNLNFDAQHVYANISHGWGDFTFSGNVQYANLNIRSNGYCDLLGMNIQDSVTVISNTQGDVKVKAQGIKLKVQTLSDGDVYYKGIPSLIEFDQFSNGQLIDMN